MAAVLWVALGGGCGAVCRYLMSQVLGSADWPLATAVCNLSGSFVIGLVAAVLLARPEADPLVRPLAVTGFLGGFTTFSSFSLDNLRLLQSGRLWEAAAYAAGSVLLGLFLVFAGYKAGMALFCRGV
ncbi:MAG: fluoride efflux transporter CrcB [Succinivibrionaceae bacterium]|nr:fluoride efflux transporter CrcB [Succinivibrionaceae bacterium]